MSEKKVKIGILVGEDSGDQLGAYLISDLKKLLPNLEFVGIGGSKMSREGFKSYYDMSELSVMGIIEPILKLPKLLFLRNKIKRYLLEQDINMFVGIDSPDFNLPIAKYLKENMGIRTIQYVSPSIWAWRENRITSIEKSVDDILALFPFEKEAYKDSPVQFHYVGHPLAHSLEPDTKDLTSLQGEIPKRILALLPGSRKSEIKKMSKVLFNFARKIESENKGYSFVMPLSQRKHAKLLDLPKDLDIEISYENSQEILKIAEYGIITSGTASLEALLLDTPSVVIYKTNWLTYKIIKPMLKANYFSLPNLLNNEELLPELLQNEVTVQNIYKSFKNIEEKGLDFYLDKFQEIRDKLKANGRDSAAKILYRYLVD